MEPYLHTFPFIYGLGTATAGLALNAYNNATLWCHFGPSYVYEKELLWTACILNIYCMSMICHKIWKTEKASARFSQTTSTLENYNKTKMTAVQGFFYCFSFILTWIFPSMIFRSLDFLGLPTNCILLGFVAWFPCFQGMMNFLVFICPKLVQRYSARSSFRSSVRSKRGSNNKPKVSATGSVETCGNPAVDAGAAEDFKDDDMFEENNL
ncbi:hypothetical protein ACHAWF_007079 [Thalassiosira exigua]